MSHKPVPVVVAVGVAVTVVGATVVVAIVATAGFVPPTSAEAAKGAAFQSWGATGEVING